MKYKNVFEIFVWVLIVAILVVFVGINISLFEAKKNAEQRQITQSTFSPNSEIAVKEKGMIDSYRYLVFEDTPTKTRILYYKEAMVLLPKKEGM